MLTLALHHPRGALLGGVLLCFWATLAPPADASGEEAERVGGKLREILLGGPGEQLGCPRCPDEPPVRVDAATGRAIEVPLPYQEVNDIATSVDRKRIFLATSSEKRKRSLLLVLSAGSLSPLGRVEIPGNGRRILVSPDGYFAYLLCQRPARGAAGEGEAGQWELLGVDLGASAVVESYPLPGPATDLALSTGGERLFVSQPNRVQSFTTRPLTASWFHRSPGDNRRMAVRPRRGDLYVLRDSSVAIFEPRSRPPSAEETSSGDDASKVLAAPIRVDRIAFSRDGRLAVAAGRGLDELLVLDAEEGRVAGTWPEDFETLGSFLELVAATEKPRGPRGKLPPPQPGFSPPLLPPPSPLPPASTPPLSAAGSAASESRGGAAPVPAPPPRPAVDLTPAVPETAPTLPESARPQPAAELPTLEEVLDLVLAGRIAGEVSLVEAVVLYGPDSITAVRDRTRPARDGSYSFKLPPRGRYRIVLAGRPEVTLSCRPAFQTIEVGDYGFKGLDFKVLGAVTGGGDRQRGSGETGGGGPSR